jgi:manganese efflux pump family protein
MPIIGLLLGHGLAAALGHAARWIGAGLLIATGIYALVQAVRGAGHQPGGDQPAPAGQHTGPMLVTGLALSIDNLAVGFALGAYRVNVAVAAVVRAGGNWRCTAAPRPAADRIRVRRPGDLPAGAVHGGAGQRLSPATFGGRDHLDRVDRGGDVRAGRR